MSFNWRRFHTDWLVTRTFRITLLQVLVDRWELKRRSGWEFTHSFRLASIDEPEINKKIKIWLVVSNIFIFQFIYPLVI